MSSKRNQSSLVSPDEAMNSYIGDLLWGGDSPLPEERPDEASVDTQKTNSLQSISNNIKADRWLIPLTSLDRYELDFAQPKQSLASSFILLLWGLYFLRKPITGRLRARILEHCDERMMEHQMLMDITRLRDADKGDA